MSENLLCSLTVVENQYNGNDKKSELQSHHTAFNSMAEDPSSIQQQVDSEHVFWEPKKIEFQDFPHF